MIFIETRQSQYYKRRSSFLYNIYKMGYYHHNNNIKSKESWFNKSNTISKAYRDGWFDAMNENKKGWH